MSVLQHLRRLGDEALAFGLERQRATQRPGPFVFFEQSDGVVGHKELVALGNSTQDLQRARAAVSRDKPSFVRYALGYIGQIDAPDGRKCQAVIVELGERRLGAAMRLARSCERATPTDARPVVLSDTDNLLERDAPPDAEDLDVLSERYLVVVCPHCDRKNRVALSRVRGAQVRCGACKRDLAAPARS